MIRRESQREAYDVIVIGSGMGGLSAAALLAKAGKSVLVVERHDRPGGYAHSFRRKQYVFDAAVHLVPGLGPDGQMGRLLEALGVADRCVFTAMDPLYHVTFPGLRVPIPATREAFVQAHAASFPDEATGFERLTDTCFRLADELVGFPPEPGLRDYIQVPKKFPLIMRYNGVSTQDAMDEFVEDYRAKALFAALWPFIGLPPQRSSFVFFAAMIASLAGQGAYYCQGSFQNLSDAFVAALEGHGGELLTKSRVRRILIENGRAEGVVLENGQRIHAPVVISNADARETFDELVGAEHVPRKLRKQLDTMRVSLSAFVVYMATDLDLRALGAHHEMIRYRSWRHDSNYRGQLAGQPLALVINIPSLIDSSLAPEGQYVVTVTMLVPYDAVTSWRAEKERYTQMLIDEAEDMFPGFRSRLLFAEGASPRTMERYTLNSDGAMYGWEQTSEKASRGRLPHQTPIPGLFLSGHWTRPGANIYGVMLSGMETARLILGHPSTDALLQAVASSGS